MSLFFVSQATLWRQRWQNLRRLGPYVRRAVPFMVGLLAALVALWLYDVFVPDPPPLTVNEVNDSIAQAFASATPPAAFSAYVYQAILPSLVFIQTETPDADGEAGHGIGSGVVVDDQGDVLTSLHVVAGASEIRLTFADGSQSNAQVIAEEPENDIAVLRPSQPPGLIVPATLGNPNAMRVGDEAFVVGNPLGLFGSMSAGVISGFNRSFRPLDGEQKLEGLIQIDAAVNPGNSGGPLLNRSGQVIGIVTARAQHTEEDIFMGIGFAVPINIAGGVAGLPPY